MLGLTVVLLVKVVVSQVEVLVEDRSLLDVELGVHALHVRVTNVAKGVQDSEVGLFLKNN